MALFGKKNKSVDADTEESKSSKKNKTKGKKSVNMNRKKKGHTLTITVKESATELLQENTPFIVNGKTVGAAVNISEAIGDLTNKKDTNVGQIVNYINHGTISAIVLDMLLEDDTIVIIPDSETIDTMRAYDSFKNAKYEFCYVDLSEGMIEPCFEEETKFSFTDLENIAHGKESLANKLGVEATSSTNNDDDLDDPWDDDLDDPLYADSDENDIPDEFPDEFGDMNDDIPPDNFEGSEFPSDDEFADVPPTEDFAIEPEPEPEPDPDPFEETTTETISETAVRTFMVDDISIEVSDEPFNMTFNASDIALFADNRPTDEGDNIANHMNECLNTMAKAANTEIKHARANHIQELRSAYVNLLGEYVRTVVNSELSTYGDTASAQERDKIEEAHKLNLSNIDKEVDERKDIIDKEYNDAIATVRKAAAENAEREYRENHQKQYVAQIDSIRTAVEEEIENQYINDIAAQNEKRHIIACEMVDEAVVNVIDELTTKYADMISAENDIYKRHQDLMTEFVNQQRANEMERVRILQEEHSRSDIEQKMSAKHAAEIADITSKFNAQKKNLEADLQAMRDNIDIAVSKATAEAERTVSNLHVENKRLSEEAERAKNQKEEADARAEAKYKYEIERLHSQIDNWENETKRLHGGQKTYILIMLGIALSGIIAAGAIGYISGQSRQAKNYMNSLNSTQSVQQNYDYNNNQQNYNNSNDNQNYDQSQSNDNDQSQNDNNGQQQQSQNDNNGQQQQSQNTENNDSNNDDSNTQSNQNHGSVKVQQ